MPGFEDDAFGLETSRLAACSFSVAHLSFSSSSFLRLLSSKAALRSSFFLRLSSACFSRSSLTFSCLWSSEGASLPLKFSVDIDRLPEFALLALVGRDCAEVEFEGEGFNEFAETLLPLVLDVEAGAKHKSEHTKL